MGKGKSSSKETVPVDEWQSRLQAVPVHKQDLDRLVMNYLVTEGYVDAAQKFSEESGTPPALDLAAITDRMQIRRAVQNGDIESAIDRVNDLDPQILEEDEELFFHLQQQRLIELIRAGDVDASLEFAQECLAPLGEDRPAFLEEVERTVALLLFEDARAAPRAELLEPAQRQKTASRLNAAVLRSQSQEARLPHMLKLLVWMQERLQQRVNFPAMHDLLTAELTLPDTEMAS